jgi:hypothetical protein
MTSIDEYSLATVPISQLFNDTELGNATAFIWKNSLRHFLVTNWHIVTCKHFETVNHLTNHGGRPNKLRALFNPPRRKDPSDAQIGMVWHSALVDEIITAGKRDQY